MNTHNRPHQSSPDAGSSAGHLAVVPYAVGEVVDADGKRLDRIAKDLRQQEPALGNSDWFGPLVNAGMGVGPWTILSDHREITLATEEYASLYEYRLAMLARDGDRVVLSTKPHEAFEDYRSERLGLGSLVSLQAGASSGARGQSLAARCMADDAVIHELAELASRTGELTLVPYMGSGQTWLLARQIARRAGTPVYVAAPPPALSKRVNDKVWFARLVEATLGPRALPKAIGVSSAAALAMKVRELSEASEVVVVKIPDSAGSSGNIVLPSHAYRRRKLREIRQALIGRLQDVGWNERYPLVVQIWESNVWRSPSVQIWVPNLGQGLPVIEGIFEQIVESERGTFIGSQVSHLPDAVRQCIIRESSMLAGLFQRLGYFGRMSLDCILTGQPDGELRVHWIECNGRWGGVSIPMSLVNRLTGGWLQHPFVVAQRSGLEMPSRSFAQVLDLLADILYPQCKQPSGVVLMGPTAFETGRGYQFVAIAESENKSRRLIETAIARLRSSGEF